MNDRADGFTLVHKVKSFIDILQSHGVSDKSIEFEFSIEITLHITRQFCSAFSPAKRRAAPDAPRYQLKRTGANFFAGTGNAESGSASRSCGAALVAGVPVA